MDAELRRHAEAARGFMPADEGTGAATRRPWRWRSTGRCWRWARTAASRPCTWARRARALGRVLFTVDHHRGSEENQPGWEWHEPDLVDPAVGKMDTLPFFRKTIHDAGLEGTVIAVVGDSPTVASAWATPLAFLFIDGGHGEEPARVDYERWTPHVVPGGTFCIHDVFPDPADGGRPPYEQIYLPALASGRFEEVRAVGSLRVLRRI